MLAHGVYFPRQADDTPSPIHLIPPFILAILTDTMPVRNPEGWVGLLRKAIRQRWEIGELFSLDDVYKFETLFSGIYPRNSHVKDKLRQTLQFLRDQGLVEFVDDHGMYRRIGY